MDEINVRRWARSLRKFHRNDLQPSMVTDVCLDNTRRMKMKTNESSNDNEKYSFQLTMSNSDQSSVQSDLDAVSECGTYIIEDDPLDEKNTVSFKRYVRPEGLRHGTFDIHGLLSSTSNTIHRPVVDKNIPKGNLYFSSSSSNSSLVSVNDEDVKISVRSQLSTTPTQFNPIKPAESFVISPIFEHKSKSKEFSMKSSAIQKPFQSLKISLEGHSSSNMNKPVLHSLKSTGIYSQHHTNRAVELRRARAQAKMEELTKRTKKSSQKPRQSLQRITNPTKFDSRRKFRTEKEDLFSTRTISSNPTEDLLNNGQRLTIKLIQLSSAILEKLKPNESLTIQNLTQLVDQLQTVNETLTSIDTALTGSTSSEQT